MNPLYPILVGAALLAGGCAGIQVPEPIRPAPNESFALTVAARGVQIYECRTGKNGRYEWTFVAPDAELFNQLGRPIGSHGAGPFWQAADGSRVIGTVKARADAPQAGAIPWLLLAAKSTTGQGAFSATSSIQRINTVGGVAPANGCSADAVGKSARVPYTADYVFFTAR